jgi:hypothetical protein
MSGAPGGRKTQTIVPDLPAAHLRGAILIDANLRSANLNGARTACLASIFRRRGELPKGREIKTHTTAYSRIRVLNDR